MSGIVPPRAGSVGVCTGVPKGTLILETARRIGPSLKKCCFRFSGRVSILLPIANGILFFSFSPKTYYFLNPQKIIYFAATQLATILTLGLTGNKLVFKGGLGYNDE